AEFFEAFELNGGRLPLAPDRPVVGGVVVVEAALRQLGVAVPPPPNLPACLAEFFGRRVWATTWKAMREHFREERPPPAFVKPLSTSKTFPGYVIYGPIGLVPTERLPEDMDLQASECVEFVSEWRCFVHRHEVVGLSRYKGDIFGYPDADVIRAAVRAYQ